MDRPRVVILGGGMAGLATAWELSAGDWRDRLSSITVYQRGWRLGGKGASSRGPHGRVEEHGLHVLLGYYDATFRVLRGVYDELDRATTDPGCPILTWRDAIAPAPTIGLADPGGDGWEAFVTRFSTNDAVPGEPGAEDHRPSPAQMAARALRLLADFHLSLLDRAVEGGVFLSASPKPPESPQRLSAAARGMWLTALAGLLEALRFAAEATAGAAPAGPQAASVDAVLRGLRDAVHAAVAGTPDARRTWQLVDLVLTNVRGMVTDRLLAPGRLGTIDHLDYREWLRIHGAAEETVDSPIVRGMYDLAFAYEDGDPARPSFSAGLGLDLAMRMLLEFKGSIFWKMQAGMGETVMAPLYQALRSRGVEFRFFHRLDGLRLDDERGAIASLELGRQAAVSAGAGAYQPLVNVAGLPCWPAAPLVDQLETPVGPDTESLWCATPDAAAVELRAGEDFDVAVLAVSLGMVPHVCADIVATDDRWAAMVGGVRTVATQSFQLWLTEDEKALGWNRGGDVTLSGFVTPFDTWASMSHLLGVEQWPSPAPESVAYFCSALPEAPVRGAEDAAGASAEVRERARRFLDEHIGALWPDAVGDAGFRWELLWSENGGEGPVRLDGQYWRANVDPSDRYVQSVPGSGALRIAPGDSGYANLVLAGDWTDCGLNAGCVEAATRSGVLAARAVLERAGPSPC